MMMAVRGPRDSKPATRTSRFLSKPRPRPAAARPRGRRRRATAAATVTVGPLAAAVTVTARVTARVRGKCHSGCRISPGPTPPLPDFNLRRGYRGQLDLKIISAAGSGGC